jgi:uncharacterized membrane protein
MTEQSTGQTFEQSMTIHAPPDSVFAFVSDVKNMPKYLPTMRRAEEQGDDRVRVQGEAEGHRYDADGFLRADAANRRMEWGADEHHYKGQLAVEPAGADASQVTVRLMFKHYTADGAGQHGPSSSDIEEGLRNALQSIENEITGTGGKKE